jgi:hypothetical protein
MIEVSLKADFTSLERAVMALADRHMKIATATALTRVAWSARQAVMDDLPKIFHEPVRFTLNSIRVKPANKDKLVAMVYISEDAAKGISPRNYLRAEIEGGARGDKRSERAFKAKGIMAAGQQMVPGEDMKLNAAGNIPGPRMVQILSGMAAFSETGYQANMSDKRKKQLAARKLAVASKGLAHPGTESDYFAGKGKWTDGTQAIYQIVGKHKIKLMLYFVDKRPSYKPRFHFEELVAAHYKTHWPAEMMRALNEELARAR